jgi:hypothetical protein
MEYSGLAQMKYDLSSGGPRGQIFFVLAGCHVAIVPWQPARRKKI